MTEMEYHLETLREFNQEYRNFVKKYQDKPSKLKLVTIFKLLAILTTKILDGGMPSSLYLPLCKKIRTAFYDLLEVECKNDKEYLQICDLAKGLKGMFDHTIDIYLYIQTA
jgi:hypothetical protein